MQSRISIARAFLLSGLAAGAFTATPALAQDATEASSSVDPADAADEGNAIIVTARRIEENLMEVPLGALGWLLWTASPKVQPPAEGEEPAFA